MMATGVAAAGTMIAAAVEEEEEAGWKYSTTKAEETEGAVEEVVLRQSWLVLAGADRQQLRLRRQ